LLAVKLIERYRSSAVVGLMALAVLTCSSAVAWSAYRPAEAEDFNVDRVAAWLNRDGHDQYRYFTLGFGYQISRLAVLTHAGSVDGEWNSGRTLPELTQHGSGALTSSKYFGAQGLDALRAMMMHADRYGLKWIIVRDPYYDALLNFAGWRPVDYLDDKTITVWAKDSVPPATAVNALEMPPRWQGLMWGIFPFGSSILAIFVFLIPEKKKEQIGAEYPAGDPTLAGRRLVL
jgi:hypothetical protein